MATSYEVAERWTEVLLGRSSRKLTARNVFFEGPVIYSYGRHFPLAQYLQAGRAGRRRPLILLNGDRFSVTTSRHQEDVRAAIQRNLGLCDQIILPYSALEAAGISRETIRPLEVLDDRWETTEHESAHWTDLPLHERYTMREVERTAAELESVPAEKRSWWTYSTAGSERHELEPVDGLYRWTEYEKVHRDPDSDGLYRWTTQRHFLGGSLFSAAVDETRIRRRPVTVRDVIDSALMRRDETLESLGETIAETVRVTRRHKYLSAFDANERVPLYFLATLPATPAQSVEAALDALAPRAVHAAYARGLDVERQGDMFALETKLDTASIYGRSRARTRRSVWAGNGRPRPGEVSYLSDTERAERVKALYRQNRAAGWSSGKPRVDKPVPPAEVPPTPETYAERIKNGRETVHELQAELEAFADVGEAEAVPPALEAARLQNRHEVSRLWTARHYRHEAEVARETLADRLERYGPATDMPDPAGQFAGLIAEAEAEIVRTAERYAEHSAELEAAEAALEAAEREHAGYVSRETRRAERAELEKKLATASTGLAYAERAEAARIAEYVSARETIRANNRTGGRPLPNGPSRALDALDRARWSVNALATGELAETLSLHGTGHTATEVVKAAGGLTYVRGYLYHEPALDGPNRERDHARRKLGNGKTWYLAIRNTVPRNRNGRR